MENNDKNDKYEFNAGNPKTSSTKGRSFGLFVAMFWAFFFALALSNIVSPYFSQIISGLLSGVTPLLIGMAVAFIFYRLVDFIERVILKNAFANSPYKFAIKRTISILVVLLFIIGILAIVLAILVPKITEVVNRIMVDGEVIYNDAVKNICDIVQRWFGAEVSQEAVKDICNKVYEWFFDTVGQFNDILKLSLNVLSALLNVLLGMLVAILILKDKERISRFCRRYSYTHFKKERADEICVIANNANKILFNYVICKIIEFTIIFVSMGILYMILGLEFTWELALLIGLFNFIPYFGIYLGAIVAALITLIFNGVNPTLYMLISTFIICTIEFNVILPFITSSRLKVSALIVVSSTIIGGAMFGMAGMLLAPPIFALISVVITGNIELKENHMKYVMELNKARERNMQDEKEQLGIMPLTDIGKSKDESQDNSQSGNNSNANNKEVEDKDNNELQNSDNKISESNTNNKEENKENNKETNIEEVGIIKEDKKNISDNKKTDAVKVENKKDTFQQKSNIKSTKKTEAKTASKSSKK